MRLKKLLILFATTATLFSFTGCSCSEQPIQVNVSDNENLNGTTFGENALIEIGNKLYYDSTTRIVYWWNGELNVGYCATTPSPYYAPNGLPYRYNPETNTFEEIEVN